MKQVVSLKASVAALSVVALITVGVVFGLVQPFGDDDGQELVTGPTEVSTEPLAIDVTATPAGNAAIAVSAGQFHTCALTAVGGVKCWGVNRVGQLGDGTTTDRAAAVEVCSAYDDAMETCAAPLRGARAVSSGHQHACALTEAGGVKCWGENSSGALGNGTTCSPFPCGSSIPVDVTGLSSGVVAVSAGGFHTCAVTTSGGVKCWGYNAMGQLGDGTTTDSSIPVDVSGPTSGVVAVSAAGYHTCAVTTTGGVRCWGENSMGELGNGTTTGSTMPVDVTWLNGGVAAVSAGGDMEADGYVGHTCAVTSAGGVKCWGSSGLGELGNATHEGPEACVFLSACSTTPVDVSGLTSGAVAVSAGTRHTCAVTTAGGVKCWGQNSNGELGNGAMDGPQTCGTSFSFCSIVPVDVSGLASGAVAVSVGLYHTCAVTTAGGVKCWGLNSAGQLGNGATTGPEECASFNACSTAPVDVVGLGETPTAATAFTDPFAYCAAVGTVDSPDERWAGAAVAQPVDEFLRGRFGPGYAGAFWRCMDGNLMGCTVGANLPCGPANMSREPTSGMVDYCREHPDGGIPFAVTGHNNVYEWRCQAGTPVIARQWAEVDSRGFISSVWYLILP